MMAVKEYSRCASFLVCGQLYGSDRMGRYGALRVYGCVALIE